MAPADDDLRKGIALSEELYWKYWMKYRDDFNREVEEETKKKVREHMHEIARKMLVNGKTVELTCDTTELPSGEVLRIKDELDRKAV